MQEGGVVMAFGACLRCGRPFAFNPLRVPSMLVTDELSLLLGKKAGIREPICRDCFDAVNEQRVKLNLPPWRRHADAYEPLPEEEMP